MDRDNKKQYWNICLDCIGQGRIERGPSKKRRRRHQLQIDAYNADNKKHVAPEPLKKNLDICPGCAGSGLINSGKPTKINTDFPHVAIIGGGIGGTALAVACMHRGIPFTLYERDICFDARSQGYGLTLQQASRAIEGFGIFELNGGLISTRHVVHNPDGKIIGEWGMRKWLETAAVKNTKRKNIHIARQSLRLALFNQLGNHPSIQWGHKLINFSKKNAMNHSGKNVSFDLEFDVAGNIQKNTADIIVGADGIRSFVREKIIGKEATPLQYLGCMVILGICPVESLDNDSSELFDSATVFQTVNGHERMYVMPYDNTSVMWQLSFPMDESTAKELSRQGKKALKGESIKRLSSWHEPIPNIISASDELLITGYPVYDRTLLHPQMLKNAANITLIGDAAHPMSPFKGQGANQALLDALALARGIYKTCGTDSDWQHTKLRTAVLEKFEYEMINRSASKVQDSARAVELLHSDAVMHDGDAPRGRGLFTK